MELVSELHENKILNWIQKHAVEVLIALSVAGFGTLITIASKNKIDIAVINSNVEHINDAVNNVGKDEETLREAVDSLQLDVEVIKNTLKRMD